jgi:hypothetical protein
MRFTRSQALAQAAKEAQASLMWKMHLVLAVLPFILWKELGR